MPARPALGGDFCRPRCQRGRSQLAGPADAGAGWFGLLHCSVVVTHLGCHRWSAHEKEPVSPFDHMGGSVRAPRWGTPGKTLRERRRPKGIACLGQALVAEMGSLEPIDPKLERDEGGRDGHWSAGLRKVRASHV